MHMRDDVFGEEQEPQGERQVKVIWPLRSVNVIEGALLGAMTEAMAREVDGRAPILFVGEGENGPDAYAEIYGQPFTVAEAMILQDLVRSAVIERFRRQLIIARECGDRATITDYVAACAAENVSPLLEKIK
jgi:hypothetical protein